MLQAQLRGKLRRTQENLEDLLTSSVFGALKYVSSEDGLCTLLGYARAGDSGKLRLVLADRPFQSVEYQFWRPLKEPDCIACEPDVLLEIRTRSGRLARILIEAKYRSGKSSEALDGADATQPPNDQLAREWDNLSSLCSRDDAIPILVYLTADPSPPRQEIEASQRDLTLHHRGRGNILWLSWRDCAAALAPIDHPMISDLCGMLRDRYGFTRFEGIVVPAPTRASWAFADASARIRASTVSQFDWSGAGSRCRWSFARSPGQSRRRAARVAPRAFAWPSSTTALWRFA
jgi:hypothetical protein